MAARISARDAISAAREYARRKAPYFGTAILAARYHELTGLGTVGITPGGVVVYDPDWVRKTPTPQLAGVVVHEVAGHWMRNHEGRCGTRDRQGWNIACDASINGGLVAAGWELPPEGVFPDKRGWPPNLLPEQYYELLEKQASSSSGDGEGKSGSSADPNGDPRSGTPRGLGQDLLPIPGGEEIDRQYGNSEAARERTARAVADAVAKHVAQHGQGSVPAGWAAWADEQLAPPKIRWQSKLARACRRAITLQMGAVDYTYRAPSRRQAGMGFGAGRPIMPTLRRPVPDAALINDTSGSMGTKEITACMAEVAGVFRAIGAPVHLLSCDAAVHDTIRVASRRDLRRTLNGGGGTDFRPGIVAALECKPRPEVIVYLTDGYGTFPSEPPVGVRVIWCLIGRHTDPDNVPWGEVIEVPQDE